jgi:hypothetical protein
MSNIIQTTTPEAIILDLPEKKLRVTIAVLETTHIDTETGRTEQISTRAPILPNSPRLVAELIGSTLLEAVNSQEVTHGR